MTKNDKIFGLGGGRGLGPKSGIFQSRKKFQQESKINGTQNTFTKEHKKTHIPPKLNDSKKWCCFPSLHPPQWQEDVPSSSSLGKILDLTQVGWCLEKQGLVADHCV